MLKNLFSASLSLLVFFQGIAQGTASFDRTSFGVSYDLQPERPFKDSAGGYKYRSFAINAKIPLFGNRSKASRKFYETYLHADFQSGTAGYGFISGDRNFLSGSAGLGAIVYKGGKNILLMNASVGLAADKNVIDKGDARYRFSGLFLVNHLHSKTTIYQYGIAFTYAYGRPLPLPVLGIRTKIAEHWTLSAILPVELNITDRINTKTGLSFFLRPAGNRFQFDNQYNFKTSSQTVFLQLREFSFGGTLHYKLSKDFTISGDAGLRLGGKLKFAEQDDRKNIVYETATKPGGMFRVALRYRLPRKASTERYSEMENLINPLGN